ncbi:hypothetical protein FISHEDRAFT_24173, partial [Fistulina hepatica ATCC 64428]
RPLSDGECSYYLPSRHDGVNDMYLHLQFSAPARVMKRSRVGLVWAIMRARHPLLCARVDMRDYNDIHFVYDRFASPQDILRDAHGTLEYRRDSSQELIDTYLNGPRTLSNERLSYLILSGKNLDCNGFRLPNLEIYDLMICAAHFIGDGMALHQFANTFLETLSKKNEAELESMLEKEWAFQLEKSFTLPPSMESRLEEPPKSRLGRAMAAVDFQRSQERFIGGHAFPKTSGRPRRTVVPTVAIDRDRTARILKKCKAKGVSISASLFAICNFAWASVNRDREGWKLPLMMYTALNMRPYLRAEKALHDSYWFISIGYINVVLPAFIPATSSAAEKTFWHRARLAKRQCTAAAKNSMIASRCHEMARERAARAQKWAREDDEALHVASAPAKEPGTGKPTVPSVALLGLSLLGNLDGTYKHAEFQDVKLRALTTGSRQRSGGLLLFGYTFVGKLWLSLGYDINALGSEANGQHTPSVDKFWDQVLRCVDEFL